MRLYLASWVGDGTAGNEYRPNLDAGAWAAIDLRPDVTVLEGRVLVGTDQPIATLPSGVTDLGDALDEALRTPVRRGIESALGVVLLATTLRGVIAELLIVHGEPDLPTRTRWKRLKATRQGRHVIKLLRETIYDAPVIVGTTITDDFDRVDSVDLGDSAEGWSWAEVVPDIDIVSNQAFSDTNTNVSGRAESDLASDDHYAEADVTWGSGGSGAALGGTLVRFAPSATTHYRGGWVRSAAEDRLQRIVSGSGTNIATQANTQPVGSAHVYTEADGSSISTTVTPGPGALATTDTNITGHLRTGIGGFAQLIHTWDNFEAADLVAGGVTGTSAVTQDDQTSAASGTVVPPAFTGTAAPTQDDQTSTASGTVDNPGVSGTLAVTQENQVSTASGTFTPPPITGTASPTQDDQTSTASGTVTAPAFTGTSATTQDDQTSTASGTVTTAGIAGSLAVTQDDQTSTATGTHVPAYSGTLAVTQDDQVSAATGDVGALTFWTFAPVAYTAAPVAYTPIVPDEPPPW